MARYFYGNSESQGGGDGLQTLILMNPAYAGYSDPQPPPPQQLSTPNFVVHNSENAFNLPRAPTSQRQHLIGIPLEGLNRDSQHQDVSVFHGFLPRVQHGLYNPNTDTVAARDGTRSQQGLSLSLSSSQQPPPGYGSFLPERELAPPQPLESPPRAVDSLPAGSPASQGGGVQNGVTSVMLSSKYLKAAQELLDEVVNVGKGSVELSNGQQPKKYGESATAAGGGADAGKSGAVGGVKRGSELSTAEKQEMQMKKAKLVNMLDEVEQRYRQYHHQMQVVISWFEQASGVGSAKTYTALALQTISKQFRCLKDAILGQVRTASKNLGEEDALGGKAEGSRLKYVDNQIRQQRALQQLGMIQHNAWRPQRGLPEQSVTVLRSWLFEHFLHPYPKDSDKVILAKQTGLTRSQVSNWFINARVRLWKPMVEEMYMEEVKGVERIGSEDKNSPSTEQHQDSISKSTASRAKSPIPENRNNAGFDLIGPTEMDSITQGNSKKQRKIDADMSHSLPSTTNINLTPMSNEDNDHMSMKFKLMGGPANFIGGFGSYPIAELERYDTEQFQAPYSGSNGVSLTLGLPRMGGGSHPAFLPTSDFSGMNTPTSDHSDNVYQNIDIQNRKRFAAELMPDFVA